MKKITLLSLSLLFSIISVIGQHDAVDHSIWNNLLKTYVSDQGDVDYKGLMEKQEDLKTYLDNLSNNIPDVSRTDNEALAYWINAYNAFTVSLILQNYPLKSITDLDKPWDTPFIKLGKKTYSLNQIEHEIIRPVFNESRIHFVLVCAAKSCPRLLNESYDPGRLNEQLEQQGRSFINNPSKNRISKNDIWISKLFSWYTDDFTTEGSLQEYVNHFSDNEIAPEASIEYLDYSWDLNEK